MKESNEIFWDSNLYQEKHAFVYQFGEQMMKLLNPIKGESILDLGCGNGQLTAQIAASGAKVAGIDASPEMILSARENYPDINFQVGNAESFPFTELYDAVFSNAVMHWVKDQKAAAHQIYACLKPGGRFVAEFGGKGNNQNLIQALKNNFVKENLNENASVNFWYFPSIGTYAQLLEQAGFDVKYCHLFPRPTMLKDAKNGIKDWFRMFGEKYLDGLEPALIEKILTNTQEELYASNFKDGNWYADYVRLRVIATK